VLIGQHSLAEAVRVLVVFSKELIAMDEGYRESGESWANLLRDPLVGEIGQIRRDLGLQGRGEHPPGAFPHYVIQQRHVVSRRTVLSHYGQHRACLPDRRANVGHAREPAIDHSGRYALPSRSTGIEHCSFRAVHGEWDADSSVVSIEFRLNELDRG
jgi:hypothetical protein